MVRRNRIDRSELQLALHISEIERLQAIMAKITDGRSLVITPSDPGAGGPTTPPIEGAAHVLYGSKHTRALRVTDNGGLNISFEQGQIWVGGTFFSIVAGTLALTDNATNFVYVDNAGVVADNTTAFPSDSAPMAQVTTLAGDITAVADRRAYLSAGTHGSGAVLGNPLIVGVDDTTAGILRLYGNGVATLEGAEIQMFLAADHHGVFHSWNMDVNADDLRWFRSSGELGMLLKAERQLQLPTTGVGAGLLIGGDAQIYRSAAGVLDMPDGTLVIGVDDTVHGELWLRGHAAGSFDGGELRLYLADDHDATIDYWAIISNDVNLLIQDSLGNNALIIDTNQQVRVPSTLLVDIINEFVAAAGVTIETVLIKDNLVQGRSRFVPLAVGDFAPIGGATRAQIVSRWDAWEFTNGVDESIVASVPVPNDWDASSAFTFKIHWVRTDAAAAGNVRWRLLLSGVNDTATVNVSDVDTSENVAVAAQDILDVHTHSVSFTPNASDEWLGIILQRVGTDGGDTHGQPVFVVGVEIEYTGNI